MLVLALENSQSGWKEIRFMHSSLNQNLKPSTAKAWIVTNIIPPGSLCDYGIRYLK